MIIFLRIYFLITYISKWWMLGWHKVKFRPVLFAHLRADELSSSELLSPNWSRGILYPELSSSLWRMTRWGIRLWFQTKTPVCLWVESYLLPCWSAAPPCCCPPHSPPGSLHRPTSGSGSTSPACSSLWGCRSFPVRPPLGGNRRLPSPRPGQT